MTRRSEPKEISTGAMYTIYNTQILEDLRRQKDVLCSLRKQEAEQSRAEKVIKIVRASKRPQ
jgi:hypothetical protein